MAAEADVGHYMQHTINTSHYRDTQVVLGNENKNAASLFHSPLRFAFVVFLFCAQSTHTMDKLTRSI